MIYRNWNRTDFYFLYHWRCRTVPPCSIILISTTKYQLDWKIILPGWSEFLSVSPLSCLPLEHQYLYFTGTDEMSEARPIQDNIIVLKNLFCSLPPSHHHLRVLLASVLNFQLQCSESLVLIIPFDGHNILSRWWNLLSFHIMWCLLLSRIKLTGFVNMERVGFSGFKWYFEPFSRVPSWN